jgi:Ca-activated chloride channel family protein
VLATRPIAVVATEVSITGPESVEMGRTFEVSWIGPGGNRDHAQIYDPDGNNGNGRVIYERRFVNEDFDNRKARLIAPVAPGDYLLRYWDGQGRKPLATSPITVVATEVTITAPDAVKAGENFEVSWVGPGAIRDTIEVMDGDRRAASARLSNGDYDAQTVSVKAPKDPGSYTLRYYNGDYDAVLATQPITVE